MSDSPGIQRAESKPRRYDPYTTDEIMGIPAHGLALADGTAVTRKRLRSTAKAIVSLHEHTRALEQREERREARIAALETKLQQLRDYLDVRSNYKVAEIRAIVGDL